MSRFFGLIVFLILGVQSINCFAQSDQILDKPSLALPRMAKTTLPDTPLIKTLEEKEWKPAVFSLQFSTGAFFVNFTERRYFEAALQLEKQRRINDFNQQGLPTYAKSVKSVSYASVDGAIPFDFSLSYLPFSDWPMAIIGGVHYLNHTQNALILSSESNIDEYYVLKAWDPFVGFKWYIPPQIIFVENNNNLSLGVEFYWNALRSTLANSHGLSVSQKRDYSLKGYAVSLGYEWLKKGNFRFAGELYFKSLLNKSEQKWNYFVNDTAQKYQETIRWHTGGMGMNLTLMWGISMEPPMDSVKNRSSLLKPIIDTTQKSRDSE